MRKDKTTTAIKFILHASNMSKRFLYRTHIQLLDTSIQKIIKMTKITSEITEMNPDRPDYPEMICYNHIEP